MTLDELPRFGRGIVTRLDVRGSQRRRLMDLGVLPGAEIVVEGTSPLGDPTAYVIRGAVIALRRVQAKGIHVVAEVDR